jgi:hypothetical protein
MDLIFDLLTAHARNVVLVETLADSDDEVALAAAVKLSEEMESEIVRTRSRSAGGIGGKLRIAVERARQEYPDEPLSSEWALVESALLDLFALSVSGGAPSIAVRAPVVCG